MKLLEPYFLYAFLALAIPIIIHLFSLQKHKTVYFSNVSILRQLEQKKSAINSFKKLLLLLTRLLLLSAIILAFSEPYFNKNNSTITEKNIVGIYLDNSFSMNGENEKGILIQQAKNKARNILNAHKDSEAFIFLSNELDGKHQRVLDYNECAKAIDQTSIKSNVLSLKPLIDRWNSLKQNNRNYTADLYLISDFQLASFPEREFTADSNFTLHLLPLSSYPQINISIDTCYLESPNHNLGGQELLNFKVTNHGNEYIQNLSVKLFINGEQKGLTNISIAANSEISSKLSYVNSIMGNNNAYIEINDGTLDFDNRLYFNYSVVESINVLSIFETQENNSLEAVFQDEIFKFVSSDFNNLNLSVFSEQNLIILDGLTSFSSGLVEALTKFTKNGGNTFIIPGEEINLSSYSLLSESLNFVKLKKAKIKKVEVSGINENHFIFYNVFEKQNKKYELPNVDLYYEIEDRYFKSEERIMYLNTNEPFINSYSCGIGTCYLMFAPLNKRCSSIEKHALFLPLLYNMALQNQTKENIYYTIGRDKFIKIKDYSNSREWRIIKEGYIDLQPELRRINQQIQIKINKLIQEDGHYLLSNGQDQKIVSFNYDRQESNGKLWDKDDLYVYGKATNIFNIWEQRGLDLERSLSENKKGAQFWHVLIMVSLVLLILESFLLKNWRQKQKKHSIQ